MIAATEPSGLMETAHLFRWGGPANAARLLTALARARGENLPAQSGGSKSFVARLALTKRRSADGGGGLAALRAAVSQPEFREDHRYWVETDRRVALRAVSPLEAILREPFVGIGVWSRRLTGEHRIGYLVVRAARRRPGRIPPGPLPLLTAGGSPRLLG